MQSVVSLVDSTTTQTPFRIVLVEDNEDDVVILARAIAATGQKIEVYRAFNCAEALAALAERRYPVQESASTEWPPDLIVVDLNLPGGSGLSLIEEVRRDASLDATPVVVLSGSDNPADLRRGYELGAHTHIKKPIRQRELAWMVASIRQFRARVARIDAAEAALRS